MGSELGPEKRRGKSLFLLIRRTAPGSPRINIVLKNKEMRLSSLCVIGRLGRGKRKERTEGGPAFLSSHRPLPAYYFLIIAGASAEERDLRTKV